MKNFSALIARKFIVFAFALFLFPAAAWGVTPAWDSAASAKVDAERKSEIIKVFKYYKNISPDLRKPTVLEVPFNRESFSIPVFAVYNLTASTFEPNQLSVERGETGSRVEAIGANGNAAALADGNYGTYTEFPLAWDASGEEKAEIIFYFDKLIASTSLSFTLDNYVALPQSISISANVAGKDYVVLAPSRLSGGSVVFPKTVSDVWRVSFRYAQPLRISEIKINDLSSGEAETPGLRFLAQPGQSYRIYFDADRYVASSFKEAGDLFSNSGIIYVSASGAIPNPAYRPADSDGDSVPDLADNCASVANSDQEDEDDNGRGDACEDYDRDRILKANDNCPEIPNYAQEDTDKDGQGDACDSRDNRITERLPWLPWAGIAVAGLVILGLSVVVLRHKKEDFMKQ